MQEMNRVARRQQELRSAMNESSGPYRRAQLTVNDLSQKQKLDDQEQAKLAAARRRIQQVDTEVAQLNEREAALQQRFDDRNTRADQAVQRLEGVGDVRTAVDDQGNQIRFVNGQWVDDQGNPVQ